MTEQKRISFKDLRKKMKVNTYYNFPNNLGEEGKDHINISIQSNTRIGKVLDPAYVKVINYKYIGKFSSVLSLWYWLRSPVLDDNIRRLTGRKLKEYAKDGKMFNTRIPNFKAIIAEATWIKLKGYPLVIKEIKELPEGIVLASYHIVKSSNLRICTSYAAMIISIGNIIVDAIKNDKEPDFSSLVDDKDNADYMYLQGVLNKLNIIPNKEIVESDSSEDTIEDIVVENDITDNNAQTESIVAENGEVTV